MLFAVQLLRLADHEPLAKGGHRNVYAYPGQPELLIKVTRPRTRRNRSFSKRLVRWIMPETAYRNALKEIECEMKAALKSGEDIAQLPLARSFGVVQTDVGPGIVVERVQSENSDLASHLSSICEANGLSDQMLGDLNRFVKKLFEYQIVGRDIHEQNIVYGLRGQVRMFLLIDGYGERNLIPLRTLSRRLNDRSLNKQMQGIADRMGLSWDKVHTTFGIT